MNSKLQLTLSKSPGGISLRISPDLFQVAPKSRSPILSPTSEGLTKRSSFGLPVLYKIGEISNYRKLISKENIHGSKLGTYKKQS